MMTHSTGSKLPVAPKFKVSHDVTYLRINANNTMNTNSQLSPTIQQTLQRGVAIPAHPLALNSKRKLDERRQRALSRYYIASGAGGIAVGVHTTQFEIRNPEIGLFKPVLELAAEEMQRADETRNTPLVRVAGVAGKTAQV